MNSEVCYNEAMSYLIKRDLGKSSNLFKEGSRGGSDVFYFLCWAMHKYEQAPQGSEDGEATDYHMALRRFVKAWLLQKGTKDNIANYYFADTAAKIGTGTTSNKLFLPILQALYCQLATNLFSIVESDEKAVHIINCIEPVPFKDKRDILKSLYSNKINTSLTEGDVSELTKIIKGEIDINGVCKIVLNNKDIMPINHLPMLSRIMLLCHYTSGMLFTMKNIDDDICNVGKYR